MNKKQKKEKQEDKNIFAGLKNGGPEHFGITPEEFKKMEKKSPLSSLLKISEKRAK